MPLGILCFSVWYPTEPKDILATLVIENKTAQFNADFANSVNYCPPSNGISHSLKIGLTLPNESGYT